MKNLMQPLSEQEMDRLEEFLMSRIDEDEVESAEEEMDEGIFDISSLDGFFTAIVSGPNLMQPSQWLPVIWGDFEPEWASETEFEEIISLLVRHMNGIAGMLIETPTEFEPIFMEHEMNGRQYLIVDEWCVGYMFGVALDEASWQVPDISQQLEAIALFGTEAGWDMLKQINQEEMERRQGLIASAAVQIHAYWYARRERSSTPLRADPRVGRNDPCPCGSGKKVKKCCRAGSTLH
jgi:uncharacterized protein